ncbi:hypothetical protein RBA69_21940 [Brenneria goodwinii]|uniref:hypothetical protein n=1 Tax=Brenneria goodwinii TaxID=1109412 RepID=UPI0036E1F12B
MARALVCLGDKTSYGIVVLATYTIIFPDGSVEADITDEQGYTRWHFSETTDNINLHILMD